MYDLIYVNVGFFNIFFFILLYIFHILQLVKLLESKEANHIELHKIKNVVDEVIHMSRNSELSGILHPLLEPTWFATGLKVAYDLMVCSCHHTPCFFFFPLPELCILQLKFVSKHGSNALNFTSIDLNILPNCIKVCMHPPTMIQTSGVV